MSPRRQSPFGRATTGVKRLIRREIEARSETIRGTVLSVRSLVDLDGAGSATWVVDVDVGGGQVLRNVAVKAGAGGDRFYAGLGQPVLLARNTQGRFDVIGPGDRVAAVAVTKTYTLGNPTPASSANTGFAIERVPFEFYQGTGGASLWNDGTTPFPLVRIVDGDGNPV